MLHDGILNGKYKFYQRKCNFVVLRRCTGFNLIKKKTNQIRCIWWLMYKLFWKRNPKYCSFLVELIYFSSDAILNHSVVQNDLKVYPPSRGCTSSGGVISPPLTMSFLKLLIMPYLDSMINTVKVPYNEKRDVKCTMIYFMLHVFHLTIAASSDRIIYREKENAS